MRNILIGLLLLVSVSVFSSRRRYVEEYFRENKMWFFQTNTGTVRKVVGADSLSFEVLDKNFGFYAKDTNYVYYEGIRIIDADPKTFETFRQKEYIHHMFDYGKDKNAVYYQGKLIIGADPNTFKLLNYYLYAIDKSSIYYCGNQIKGSSPNDFLILDEKTSIYQPMYLLSNGKVFFQADEIKEADSRTFEIIRRLWDYNSVIGRDKKHIYINGQTFTNIDAETFKIVLVKELSETLERRPEIVSIKYFYEIIVKDKNGKYRIERDDNGIFSFVPANILTRIRLNKINKQTETPIQTK